MSQTLSLPPGKYSLFITPPVAGVDFTGTPTPSVSYQWRKNGTAVSGQTSATISGVWVGETGGTVDLADGDTISIDIILTNSVSVAVKTVSAVIDASIPAPTISPLSIRLVSAPTTPVSAIPNASIGSQIMVASAGSVSVVTTPPLLPTYQWRRGFAAIAGANSQTYTLQPADADSIIDCVVSVTNSGGTASSTASVIVGTVADAGWTALAPAADSRLIYVSNDGDDVAAAAVYGRGYYLPGDGEIGADPTQPTVAVIAYKTVAAAQAKMRTNPNIDANPSADRFPDWLMFRRGDEFAGVGSLTGDVRIGGRSNTERRVYAAWGNRSLPRPRLLDASFYMWGVRGGSNAAFVSLDCPGGFARLQYGASNILIEDCRIVGGSTSGVIVEFGDTDNIVLKRNVITGKFKAGDIQGMYVKSTGELMVEECVFDRNGYNEDPFDATTWTEKVCPGPVIGGLAPGTGVQPIRIVRDRNLYLNEYDGMTLRGNIFSRNGGGSSVQMREGGIAERNLFIWNETAMGMGHPQPNPARHKGSLAENNVVLHDDCFLPPGGWGAGITASGADNDTAVAFGNIVAHFHRDNNGGQSLGLSGKSYSNATLQPASRLMKGIAEQNAIYREFGGVGLMVMDTVHDNGVLAANVSDNAVSTSDRLSMQGNASKPAGFVYSGNKFHSTTAGGLFRWGWESNPEGDWRIDPFTDGTFSQWQAAGYDADGTFTTDFAAFKSAAGWTAPERDIVSYMESVDPTYVVNEDVYVDEDAVIKQANRQKVWEVLVNHTAWPGPMAESQAKLAARRFHAFITFIQRAKENRRGAWDSRWTAEAVNNYIRAGFGKPAVSGAYDGRSLADRLLDYTT